MLSLLCPQNLQPRMLVKRACKCEHFLQRAFFQVLSRHGERSLNVCQQGGYPAVLALQLAGEFRGSDNIAH